MESGFSSCKSDADKIAFLRAMKPELIQGEDQMMFVGQPAPRETKGRVFELPESIDRRSFGIQENPMGGARMVSFTLRTGKTAMYDVEHITKFLRTVSVDSILQCSLMIWAWRTELTDCRRVDTGELIQYPVTKMFDSIMSGVDFMAVVSWLKANGHIQ